MPFGAKLNLINNIFYQISWKLLHFCFLPVRHTFLVCVVKRLNKTIKRVIFLTPEFSYPHMHLLMVEIKQQGDLG